MQLRSRRTPGHQRRREAYHARRAARAISPAPPIPLVVTLPPPVIAESVIQQRVAHLRTFLMRTYGPRVIAKQVQDLRDHLIACAAAARIERCTFQRRKEAAPCGGRIRESRQRRDGRLHIARRCGTCGREATV